MKRKKPLLALLILLVVGGVSTNARAAIDIFMQISGVPGESTDITHPGWNDVESFSHSVTKDSLSPNFADFKVTKKLDKSSPIMDLNLSKGTLLPAVLVEFQKSSESGPIVFYRVSLENVTVTSISSQFDAGGDSITENISVKFTKITWTYWPVDLAGKRGTPVTSSWDLSTGKGS